MPNPQITSLSQPHNQTKTLQTNTLTHHDFLISLSSLPIPSIQPRPIFSDLQNVINHNRKGRMLQKSKRAAAKLNELNHKNLIKRFKINFNPLLLPKLAFLGYQLKSDPSYQIFLSKLQLFDPSAIQRENVFIKHMKELLKKLERSGKEMEEKIMMVGVTDEMYKQIKSCMNFEEDKYQYGKILHSRLTDLNEFIFHVERLDREPIEEKQCKNLLEGEISKIERIKAERKKTKTEMQEEEKEEKKYFKMKEYNRLKEVNRNSQVFVDMCIQHKKERRSRKSKTEACGLSKDTDQLEKNRPVFERSSQNQTQSEDQSNSKGEKDKQNTGKGFFRKGTFQSRDSLSGKNVPKSTLRKKTLQNVMTQGNQQVDKFLKIKKNRPGKSVKYSFRSSRNKNNDFEKDKLTSIAKFRSSKSINRSESHLRESQNLSKSKHNLQKSNKKSPKITKNEQDEQNEEKSVSEIDLRTTRRKDTRSVKFSDQITEQKKSYVKQKQLRKFGRRSSKIIINISQLEDIQPQQQSKSSQQIDNTTQQSIAKITRREGFQQKIPILTNPTSRSVVNMKRKGRILGIDANKHLQRLLMEDNIQDMLLENELYGLSHELYLKYKMDKGKYASRKVATQGSARKDNFVKGKKNNILMEIDIDGCLQRNDNDKYAPSNGFNVTAKDLQEIKENFVQIIPYQPKKIAQFYGGQNFQSINHQFSTNQQGKFYFNRMFVQTPSRSIEQYIPYDFQQHNKCSESLRLDFGKQLARHFNKIDQKSLRSKVPVQQYS